MGLNRLRHRLLQIDGGRLIPATELEWEDNVTAALQPEEWPGDVLDELEAGVVMVMSDIRTGSRAPMWPSPLTGGHVRTGGNSRHSTHGGERLSDAIDYFVRWADAARVLEVARRHPAVGGLGIYDSMMLNGEPGDHCMFHIDTRQDRVCWVGHGREPVEYVSQLHDPARYHRLIGAMLEAHA